MREKTKEKKIIEELGLFIAQREKSGPSQKEFYSKAIYALVDEVRILDKSTPGILKKVLKKFKTLKKEMPLPARRAIKMPEEPSVKPAKHIRITTAKGVVTISKEDKKRFLEDVKIETAAFKKLRKTLKASKKEKEKEKEKKPLKAAYKKISPFAALSSKIFSSLSLRISKYHFGGLQKSLRKANMPFLLGSYISIMLFSVLIALVVGILGSIIITFLLSPQNLPMALVRNVSLSLLLPLIVFLIFLVYPSSEAASTKNKIENELPFVVMHMAAISGAGVEPSRVFKIIALGKEYPSISKEATKIINQVNFYGYDLVTALRETAKTAPSEKLADILNGMATTIVTGGNLHSYLDKNAIDMLHDYKLRREKYVAVSGTYADVYTGLLIAAPLIFMLLLTLINVIGIEMSTLTLGIIGIGAIIALNIGFIIFLQISQPPG